MTVPDLRALVEADERWVHAFNAGDVDTLVSLYTYDVVIMPPSEPSIHGRDAARAWMVAFFERNTARQDLVNEEVIVGKQNRTAKVVCEWRLPARAVGRSAEGFISVLHPKGGTQGDFEVSVKPAA